MLNIIQRFTELQGWKFGRLDGSTNVASRQRLVDTFNNDDSYFGMLMTTRTGGVGLNLTGADRIILYDPDWNPQTDAQARERAWRFGQEREVTIYRLISAGTVEEKIYQRQIFKTALSNRILQDPRQRRLFSQRDLKDLFTLKADGGSVISGGEGLTETGELTKGAGYVDPDEEAARENSTDDGETMKTVLKSQGLAGVFDHRVVETNGPSKTSSVREMEDKAKRIAREALIALEESVAGTDTFSPTWTGSTETSAESGTRRFGESRVTSGGFRGAGGVFGSTGIAGVNRSTAGSGDSSSALLASLRQRNEEIKTGGAPNASGTKTKEFTQLLGRIRTFVRRKMPTTDAILDEFSNIPKYDAAVFRRLLKSVARVEAGRWRLKQQG
jgi:DNA excision repair protein ERCC-6